nr:MAG TPA: hypothetical protein [Caudoviricetes sp.]DAR79029.1 MAG TPA: hypothetical protein [Caudoviricetes sp.]
MLCEKVYFHILFSSYLIFLKILKENMYTMELILLPNKGSKIQSYCFFDPPARVRHGHYITLFMLIQDILERSRTSGRGNDISGSF